MKTRVCFKYFVHDCAPMPPEVRNCCLGLEIIFLELSDKVSNGIVLTIGHDQAGYLNAKFRD